MSDIVPIILITILLFIVAIGIIMFVLVYQKKQLQHLSETEQLKINFEKEILESRLEIQEQTMKSIGQEVHDNIGQVLSVAKLNLNMMTFDEPKLEMKDKINDVSNLLVKAIKDLRNLSKSLHSDIVSELGLSKAIAREFEILKKTGAYVAILTIEGEPYNLPEKIELILFRMFQETINNIIKHAEATSVDVKLTFQPQQFTLCISDNGKGFDTSTIDITKGIGLKNIINRSELIRAQHTIESIIDKGTKIEISLPTQSF